MGKKNRNQQTGTSASNKGGSKPLMEAQRNKGEGKPRAEAQLKAPACSGSGNEGDSSECATDSESVSMSLGEEDTLEEQCSIQHDVSEDISAVPETNTTAMGVKEQRTTTAKASFASLFAGNRQVSNGTKLQQLDKVAGPLQFSEAELDSEENFDWKFSLVGYFVGKFPGKAALHQIVSGWKVKVKVNFHTSGWIIFKFDDEMAQMKVLQEGPYMIYGRPLLLKVLPKYFKFDNKELCKFPVWIQLKCLPLEFWTQWALSRICSQIGKPLYADQLTFSKTRVSYARVLVEIDVSQEVVKEVEIMLPDGSLLVQEVFYENLPQFCTLCNKVGHLAIACRAHGAANSKEGADRRIATDVTTQNQNHPVAGVKEKSDGKATAAGNAMGAAATPKGRTEAAVLSRSNSAAGVAEGNEPIAVEDRMIAQGREPAQRPGKEVMETAAVSREQLRVPPVPGADNQRQNVRNKSAAAASQASGKQVQVCKEPPTAKDIPAAQNKVSNSNVEKVSKADFVPVPIMHEGVSTAAKNKTEQHKTKHRKKKQGREQIVDSRLGESSSKPLC